MASSSRARLSASGVDRVDSAGRDRCRQGCFRVCVVTGDQHGGLVRANLLGTQGGGKGGVERLEDLRGRQRGRQFGGSGAVRGNSEGVEGFEVQRVRDVDDDLPGELGSVTDDDALQCRVRHGEDDDVAGDGCVGIGRTDVLDIGAPGAQHTVDGGTHVAGPEDRHTRHFCSNCREPISSLSCCYNYIMVVATTNCESRHTRPRHPAVAFLARCPAERRGRPAGQDGRVTERGDQSLRHRPTPTRRPEPTPGRSRHPCGVNIVVGSAQVLIDPDAVVDLQPGLICQVGVG